MAMHLAAEPRSQIGKKVKALRRAGKIPAVLYGHDVTPTPLAVEQKSFRETWRQAGSSQLVDLAVGDNTPVKILIHDLQTHPVSDDILHADLYQVKMTEKLETEIPLKLVGVAPAVTELEGSLITEKDSLEVRCLPADLVPEFAVDISILKTFDDVIKVADVAVPNTIEVLNDPDEIVALVAPPRSEEELEALKEQPTGAEAEAAGVAAIEAEAEAEKAAAEAAEKEAEKTEEKAEKS